ncbi:PIN domain-containing protein [Streptomyces sp. NBC_00365]|uniref:PIN domain-containing protein n=1 Tax=Streptomyces sp. NBC_00365 TaxID=2975726 RepID=UPI00224E06D8|nr:PIN domain-containing protein [Streptomyces sp. NBC_00365]MCX5097772.1 PIN domain-containing protein [Streptomyces sp. NBC_00365]
MGGVRRIPRQLHNRRIGGEPLGLSTAHLNVAGQPLGKAFDTDLASTITPFSAEHGAEKRRAELEHGFTVLPTPPGAAEEALAREANRHPPAEQVWVDSDGKSVKARGARDALIWLTILETASTTNEVVWFVSQDGDFGNAGRSDFHDVLRAEANAKLGEDSDRLRLLSGGVDDLLDELATKADAPEDLAAMLQGPVVAYAVHLATQGPNLFLGLLPPSLPIGIEGAYRSQMIKLVETSVRKNKTYEVGDRLWVSAQLGCRAYKSYDYSVLQAGAVIPQTLAVQFRFEATVLLEIENGRTRSAEVVSLGSPIIEGTTHITGVTEFGSDTPPVVTPE